MIIDVLFFQIIDYEQFWLDLNEANENGNAIWKSEYVFKDYFGVTNLTHEAFEEIFHKMSLDSAYFEIYHQINSVQKPDISCDKECKAYHLCAISQQEYFEFDKCIIERSSCIKPQVEILIDLVMLSTVLNRG